MALHAPSTGAPKRAPEIIDQTKLMVLGSDIQSLVSHIDTVIEVVEECLLGIRQLMRREDLRDVNFADAGDWQVPEGMMTLSRHLARELLLIGERVEMAQIDAGGR